MEILKNDWQWVLLMVFSRIFVDFLHTESATIVSYLPNLE